MKANMAVCKLRLFSLFVLLMNPRLSETNNT